MNFKRITVFLLTMLLCVSVLAGCTPKTEGYVLADDATFSTGLDEEGYIAGVKAADHVTLPQLIGVTVPASTQQVSEEDMKEQIDFLLEQYATQTEVTDRAAVDGDTVNIDYVGTVDGVEFEGGSTEGAGTDVTIGVTSYIDDFLEQIIGHMPGDTFDVEVTFPEDYGVDELNGKDAVFKTTLNYVVESVIPEAMTDDIAVDYGFETAAELEEDISRWLISVQESEFVEELLVSAVCNTVPQAALDYAITSDLVYNRDMALQYSMTLEELLEYNGYESIDAYIEANTEMYRDSAASYLIYQAIAETYDIKVTDADITAARYDDYVSVYGKPYIKFCLLQETVIPSYIVENAVVGE